MWRKWLRDSIALVMMIMISAVSGTVSRAESVTTQQDLTGPDDAELAALEAAAGGDIYTLSTDKKTRLEELIIKRFIRENFIDPGAAKAVITYNSPEEQHVRVWRGILSGGYKTYVGIMACARLNGMNSLGGYTGDETYLFVIDHSGSYIWFSSGPTQSSESADATRSICGS